MFWKDRLLLQWLANHKTMFWIVSDFLKKNQWHDLMFCVWPDNQLWANHIFVILSRRCDSIESVWYFLIMESYKVSRLRDSITQTWYFMNLKKLKNLFCSKNNLKWSFGIYTHCAARTKREHIWQVFFSVYKTCIKWSITSVW